MAVSESTQQKAYSVGYNSTATKIKWDDAKTLANGIFDGLKLGLQAAELGVKIYQQQQQAEDNAYNAQAEFYDKWVSESITNGFENLLANGLDSSVWRENGGDELLTSVTSAQQLVDNAGGTHEQAERYLSEKGENIGNYFTLTESLYKMKASDLQIRANVDTSYQNIIYESNSVDEAIKSVETAMPEWEGVSSYGYTAKYDTSKPEVITKIGYDFWVVASSDVINEAIASNVDVETCVSSIMNDYNRFVSSQYSAKGIQGDDASVSQRNYASELENYVRQKWNVNYQQAEAVASSKNSVLGNLLTDWSNQNGGATPDTSTFYQLLNQAGFSYNNAVERKYIQNALRNIGVSETLFANDRAYQIWESIDKNEFYSADNAGIGIYSSEGQRVTLPSGGDASDMIIESTPMPSESTLGSYTIVNQTLFDRILEENPDLSEAETKALAQAFVDYERSINAEGLEYYKNEANNLFYDSTISEEAYREIINGWVTKGLISQQLASELLNRDRKTLYSPYVENFRTQIESFLTQKVKDSTQKERLKNVILNGADSNDQLLSYIISRSGTSNLNELRMLTPDEIEKFVDNAIFLYNNDKTAGTLENVVLKIIDDAGGNVDIALGPDDSLFKNTTWSQIYLDVVNGEYDFYLDDEAIIDARAYLDDRANWSVLSRQTLADIISNSLYGTDYSKLGDGYKKNLVMLHAVAASAQSAQVNDLYKLLYGDASTLDSSTSDGGTEKGSINSAPNVKEVYIYGLGSGLMDSDGYVSVIDPRSYQSGTINVITMWYKTSSDEYKAVFKHGENLTLTTSNRLQVEYEPGTISEETQVHVPSLAPGARSVPGTVTRYERKPLMEDSKWLILTAQLRKDSLNGGWKE